METCKKLSMGTCKKLSNNCSTKFMENIEENLSYYVIVTFIILYLNRFESNESSCCVVYKFCA
jgi:hypothetical protein